MAIGVGLGLLAALAVGLLWAPWFFVLISAASLSMAVVEGHQALLPKGKACSGLMPLPPSRGKTARIRLTASAVEAVERLRAEALQGRVTLLIAGHDRNRTHARVLREAILGESDPDLPR